MNHSPLVLANEEAEAPRDERRWLTLPKAERQDLGGPGPEPGSHHRVLPHLRGASGLPKFGGLSPSACPAATGRHPDRTQLVQAWIPRPRSTPSSVAASLGEPVASVAPEVGQGGGECVTRVLC